MRTWSSSWWLLLWGAGRHRVAVVECRGVWQVRSQCECRPEYHVVVVRCHPVPAVPTTRSPVPVEDHHGHPVVAMPARHSSNVFCWLAVVAPVVVVVLLQTQRSEAVPPCRTSTEPEGCVHGTTKDFCDNKVCAKGPGERCGGPYYGRCGEGMQCVCGVCTGCSIATLECHGERPRASCLYS